MPAWSNKIRVVHPTQSLIPPKIDSKVQYAVYEALLRNRQLSIVYRKRGAAESEEQVVNPLGLVQRGPVLYLVCTRTGSDEVRLRALHRIASPLIMNEKSQSPAGFDLDRYIAAGNLDYAHATSTNIRLEAIFRKSVAERLLESPLSEDQSTQPLGDGRVKIGATVLDTPQLYWWLLAFGDNVEVIAPDALRGKIADAAAALHRLYHKP